MDAANDTPLLLLPGMDGTGILLHPLAKILRAHHPVQVIAYPDTKVLGYDDLTTLVLDNAPKGRFVILGESFSGPIAIEVAARERRVAGLILASSFARHPMPALFAPLAQILDLKWIPKTIIEAALLGSRAQPDVKECLGKVLATLPREIIRARVSEALRVDKRSRLRTITCPLLCLHGRSDRLVGRKCLDEIVSSHPNAEVQIFDAPHMLLETRMSEAAEAITLFCNRLN